MFVCRYLCIIDDVRHPVTAGDMGNTKNGQHVTRAANQHGCTRMGLRQMGASVARRRVVEGVWKRRGRTGGDWNGYGRGASGPPRPILRPSKCQCKGPLANAKDL